MSSDIQFLENVIDTTKYCRFCLMCRHVCPVGIVTHNEAFTPHGWGLTIASVKRGMIAWDDKTVAVLYACADCGLCNAHCATDQPLPDAIAATRAQIVGENLAPAEVYQVEALLRAWSNPYKERQPDSPNGRGEIALFVGDEAAYLWPSALEPALKLLAALGIKPVLIGSGRSNGILASGLGLPETAKWLAQATLDDLQSVGATRVLVLAPSDHYAFARMHMEREGLAWPEHIAIQEVTSLLAEAVEAGTLTFQDSPKSAAFTYLDPTHSVRVEAERSAPRKLLAAIHSQLSREVFWRQERAHPSGALSLHFTRPDLARALTHARLRDAADSGATRIITEAAGDLYHLSAHAAEFGLQVVGLYEHLAAHLSEES